MSVWSSLDPRKRIFVALATVIVFASILLLARASGAKDMSLLFGGLEPIAAGEVVKSLDQRGVFFEVRGDTIYVESTKRDSLRMSLAGDGLPANDAQGYELLDNLSGFGTTSQMFDAAYWRAKEGELARTILINSQIRSARVHISTPSTRAFQRENTPTAAVNISALGAGISSRQVKALQYLVASAVQGLRPEDVAVIDGDGGLLSESDDTNSAANASEHADDLRKSAERLLEARVGQGNAVVEISIETETETELITEKIFDPAARVAISSDVTENTTKSQDSGGDGVTVASNLPNGAASGGSGTSNNENSESRALTNYEVNETQRQLTKSPGDVRRLTVAVLINDVISVDQEGVQSSTPRSSEELISLEALVSSAIGLDLDRGDAITLKSMSFEPLPNLGTVGVKNSTTPLNLMRLIQIGVLAFVTLILGLFVVRPIMIPNSQLALATPRNHDLTLSVDQQLMLETEGRSTTSSINRDAIALPGAPRSTVGTDVDPVMRLRKMIAERETETVQILQDWMEQPEETGKA